MEKTKEALAQAFTGEAKAALRLKVFADRAKQDGYAQMAKLFRVISFSEEIHGTRALGLLQEIKSTEENLVASFEAETKVAGVAYEQFILAAETEGNTLAAMHFSQSRDVEDGHAGLYKEAMNHLMEERETSYNVCGVCGFVSDRVLPAQCPVCGALADAFVHFP